MTARETPRGLHPNSPLNPLNYKVGMWGYLLHRISGLILVAYLLVHIAVIGSVNAGPQAFDNIMFTLQSPLFLVLDTALAAAVVFHMLNGIRLILFDLGIGIRQQVPLFYAVFGLSAATIVATAILLAPKFLERLAQRGFY
jgi:succinate dehydrogenase / fumarate reductase cytochrome b subunit